MTIDLDALEATAKAATPGPWEVYGDSNIEGYEIEADNAYTKIAQGSVCKFEDAVYIAAVNPAVVLELIAELRKARAAQEWMAQIIVGHHDACVHPCKCDGCPPCEAACVKCWIEAASKAVEEKQEGEQ